MQKARRHHHKMAPTACRRMVSGTVSLPCKGCFSPFPHGTCSLSVSGECLALADGPAGFTRGSTCPALLRNTAGGGMWLRIRGCHPLRRDFPDASPHHNTNAPTRILQPPDGLDRPGLGSAPFARHYWGYHCCFLFLRLLRCFSSPGSPPRNTARMAGHHPAGLPHSDTPGSKAACASPGIFAACRVLHRLPEPRHPPCALSFFLRLNRLERHYPQGQGGGRPPSAPPRQTCRGRRNYADAKKKAAARILTVYTLDTFSAEPSSSRTKEPRLSLLFHNVNERFRPSYDGGGEWRMTDSNRRPPACKAGALAS